MAVREYVTGKLFDAAYEYGLWDWQDWNHNAPIPLSYFKGLVSLVLWRAAYKLAADNVCERRGRGYIHPDGEQLPHSSDGPCTVITVQD